MGDLKGHLLPGTFLVLYGLWWALCAIRRSLKCRQAGIRYTSSATFPIQCACCRRGTWPLESITKIIVSATGMSAEIISNLPHPSQIIVQHATMYFFFLMSGLLEVVIHLGLPLPSGVDYVSIALGFLVEGLLFVNHLHDRAELDVKIHLLLVYVAFLTAVVILLETRFQRSVMLTLSRSYLLMLQGTWMWHIGFILYGTNRTAWNLESNMDVMQAAMYFSWHCAAHFIILIIISAAMSCCYRVKVSAPFRNGSELSMTTLAGRDTPGDYHMLTAEDGDDSEVEYESPVNKLSSPA